MSRSRSAAAVPATLLLTAVSLLGLTTDVSPARAADTGPGGEQYDIRDLEFETETLEFSDRGLQFSVQSLDGSVTDTQDEKQVQLTLAADVFFAFDKDTLNVATAVTVAGLAERIGNEARGPVRIDGYTDSVGDAAYNLDLSKRRAGTVQAELERRITGKSVTFVAAGKGAADFVAPNTNADGSDNPEGRARNRRVTITYDR
jgi:OmpA-OmpF porin, OOP family